MRVRRCIFFDGSPGDRYCPTCRFVHWCQGSLEHADAGPSAATQPGPSSTPLSPPPPLPPMPTSPIEVWHEGMARCLDGRQHNMVHSGCACGNGAAMVASRDVIRAGIQSANLKRDQMKESYLAELKESLFNDLEASMLQSASLLLSKLQTAHK